MTNGKFVKHIIASPAWTLARDWGQPRPGHPEGTVGRHVSEQVVPFIDRWYSTRPEYWDLVALAYLHDIGKPATQYVDGRLAGDSHSIISAQMALELGAPDRLVQVILSNGRAYSHWRKLVDKRNGWQADRWTAERQQKFIDEFGRAGLDLHLLVLFHRADNGYRRPKQMEESTDSVVWFERQLIRCNLLPELPSDGKDRRLEWTNALRA